LSYFKIFKTAKTFKYDRYNTYKNNLIDYHENYTRNSTYQIGDKIYHNRDNHIVRTNWELENIYQNDYSIKKVISLDLLNDPSSDATS